MDKEEELKIQEIKHKEAHLQENITSESLNASVLEEDRVQEDISATGRRQFTSVEIYDYLTACALHLAAVILAALRRRSMSEVRMARTSRRISGSSIRVKDSSGSRKDEGSAVSRLLLS